MPKIVTVVGARPQFVKAGPVSRALAGMALDEVLVHTGQHHDETLSDVFFQELGLKAPDHHLGVAGGGHGSMVGRMLIALEPVLQSEAPDAVLVYGDTNSTLAAAIAAAKLQIPVAHVEAGLRAFRPMPEETNRVLTDRASRWLFCPTSTAVENLRNEGISHGVALVGDVMYDSVLQLRDRAVEKSNVLDRLGLVHGRFRLATVHRAENTNDRAALQRVLEYLEQFSDGLPTVLPLHPRTREAAARFGLSFGSLRVVAPIGYLDMLCLLAGCREVMTDSGGLQKEAMFLQRPCITMRSATEWPETIECGWNRLWTEHDYRPRRSPAGFGEGHAAGEIARILRNDLG